MNLKQSLFITFFGFTLLLGFAVLIAPVVNKTAVESISLLLQAFAFSGVAVGITIGIALFIMWIYDKLEDRT